MENLIKNIRRYRVMRGIDQDEIADRLNMSRVTYSKLENGKVRVSDDVFYQISRIFGVKPEVLLDAPEPRCKRPFFRHHKAKTQREALCVQQMLIDAEHRFDGYELLETLNEDRLSSNAEFEALRHPVASTDEAKALGSQVRALFFQQGYTNVARFADAIEANGIKFIPFDFPFGGEFGFTIRLSGGQLGIAVNTRSGISGERQLFTLCHEIGHYMMHDEIEKRSGDKELSAAETKALERQADAFASGLLMPDYDFDVAWKSTEGQLWFNRILEVKKVFSVSYQTVIYRLDERYRKGRGSNAAPPYRVWFRQNYYRRFGRELPSHEEVCPSNVSLSSGRYLRLARKAFFNEDISMGRLGELLGKNIFETRHIVNDWCQEREETKA